MGTLHVINIAIHVTAGSVALLTSLVALSVKKGGKIHLYPGGCLPG